MIAVFFHAILSGGSRPINTPYACALLQEQMRALDKSGLLAAADELHVGLNGGEDDLEIARLFLPLKAHVILHGGGATTEIPTMQFLRRWLLGHEDWMVFYHHMKSVTHHGDALYSRWLRRMEKFTVYGWRTCVAELANGTDACGCHWLTPNQHPQWVKSPFFGGTFWWSKAAYLKTLPALPAATWANRFEAEKWIGLGNPRIKDYYPGWPQ